MPEFDSTIEYRPIPGFSGYKIGSDGTVWSCWQNHGRNPRKIGDTWKERKLKKLRNGYLIVKLYDDDSKSNEILVHRLVLLAFIGPCPKGMEAAHCPDKTRSNNSLSNLRWDTKAGNAADKIKHGTVVRPFGNSRARGVHNSHAVLSEDAVHEIRLLLASGETQEKIAKSYGVAQQTVGHIATRRTWKHI